MRPEISTLAPVHPRSDDAIETIYELTGQWVSGHSLKHVVASLAAYPVIAALRQARGARQNAAGAAKIAATRARGAGPA